MNRRAAILAACVAPAALLAGCARPLPHDKLAYAGDWQSRDMRLRITPAGHCDYERRSGAGTRSVSAPIRRFRGDDFVVGFPLLSTTFVVSRPPHLEEGRWKMTVDGVELTRMSSPGEVTA